MIRWDAPQRVRREQTGQGGVPELRLAGCGVGQPYLRSTPGSGYRNAIEENPNNAQAWAALGAAQLLRRQYEPAVEALRRGLRISPTDYRRSVWLTALASALVRTGKLDQALSATQDACRADAKFYPAQIVQALVLTKLGKAADAVKALTEARRIRPRLAIGEIRFWADEVLDGAAASLGL